MLIPAVASGFAFGFGLIFSLGPQNLMLIRAGVSRNYPFVVASTAYTSEIVLVALGIGGLGTLLAQEPEVSKVLQTLCACFLAWWGGRILFRLSRASNVQAASTGGESVYQAIGSMLVVTWLNPLVWLEAMFLVGVLSTGHDAAGFAIGFLAASAIKFYGWSLAGISLSRRFGGAISRSRLDAIAGVVLLAVAASLTANLL